MFTFNLYLFSNICLAVFVLSHIRFHILFRATFFEASRFWSASNNRYTCLLLVLHSRALLHLCIILSSDFLCMSPPSCRSGGLASCDIKVISKTFLYSYFLHFLQWMWQIPLYRRSSPTPPRMLHLLPRLLNRPLLCRNTSRDAGPQ